MAVFNNILAGSSGQTTGGGPGGYEIERSLRFNSDDSAYLNRTPSVAGNRKTWTWAGWVKRSGLGGLQFIFSAQVNSSTYNTDDLQFTAANELSFWNRGAADGTIITSQIFRDVSAWYHIVLAFDSTQATESDRVKLYVNGVQVTAFSTSTYPVLNRDSAVNSTLRHQIGRRSDNSEAASFDGYLADVYLIDGQALDPTSFGEFDTNGVWQPIDASGLTYGTNGFHLPFSNVATTTTIGEDTSGNGNDWTANNFTVLGAAAPESDEITAVAVDTPTAGQITLTVASDKDLTKFTASDAVTQDSPYAALSSSITNVTAAPYPALQSTGAYLSRTPAVESNRRLWTLSLWVKRDEISIATGGTLLFANAGSGDTAYFIFNFNASNQLEVRLWGSYPRRTTTTFTSTTQWYHVVLTLDANNATQTERMIIYVDGVRQGVTGTAALQEYGVNAVAPHTLVSQGTTAFKGSLSHITFVDGQALLPSEFRSVSGTPKLYTGAFGTNGYYLPMSSATSAGTDESGSGNNWAINGTFLETVGPDGLLDLVLTDDTDLLGFAKDDAITEVGNGSDGAGKVFSVNFVTPFIRIESTAGTWNVGSQASAPSKLPSGVFVSANTSSRTLTLSSSIGAWGVNTGNYVIGPSAIISSPDTDTLVDSPTNYGEDTGAGGEVRGNYATWNPLSKLAATPAPVNGNLTVNGGNPSYKGTLLTTMEIPKAGKWYWEVSSDSANWANVIAGVADVPDPVHVTGTSIGNQAAVYLYYAGLVTKTGLLVAATSPTYTLGSSGDTYGFAADMDNGDVYLYHNGTVQNSGNPIFSNLEAVTTPLFPATTVYNVEHYWNFGQRPFAYPAPSGFKALCSTNLPEPTIDDGSTAMDVVLDTGANILSAAQGAIGGSADLLWIKDRANSNNHQLIDTVRGGTATLQSNTTAADTTYVAPTGSSVAWTWDAGSSTVTNTEGSITSQVRANASAGFSVVTYTGNGVNATVGHGLGVAPRLVIVKNRDATGIWPVFHSDMGGLGKYLILNDPTRALNEGGSYWQNTAPTSTLLYLGGGLEVNADTQKIVAYCFAPVAGYSAFGSYLSNFDNDGPFVYTGFRPRFLLIKNATDTTYAANYSWALIDTQRYPYNQAPGQLNALWANRPAIENQYGTGTDPGVALDIDILSNGFKLRCSNVEFNYFNSTYIYAAFAEHPFATSRAR